MVVNSNKIEAKASDPLRMEAHEITPGSEKCIGDEVYAPKPCWAAVLEDEPLSRCANEAVTAGRSIVQEAEIDRRGISGKWIQIPAGHFRSARGSMWASPQQREGEKEQRADLAGVAPL